MMRPEQNFILCQLVCGAFPAKVDGGGWLHQARGTANSGPSCSATYPLRQFTGWKPYGK